MADQLNRTRQALSRSTPSAQGVSAAGVDAFLDAVAAAEVELHSLMIVRHDHVVAEGWWAPYRADGVHLLYSLSKSFTSTAAGLAAADGKLSFDDPVVTYFPEHDDVATHPRVRSMRVRHLAAMATGHREDALEPSYQADPADPVRGFLQLPPDSEPGSVFAYNNAATYVLGAIVQRVTGMRLVDYLRPRVLDPLGISEAYWLQHDTAAVDFGFSGFHLTTESVAKFGELYLRDGVWDGIRLLPEGWVAEATRVHTPNPNEPNPDWRLGYGYQFWMSTHGYRGDGAYGQFCLVLPEQDAVVVTTAATEDMQAILTAAWAHLIPAMTGGPADEEADAKLAARLARLALQPVAGSAQPANPSDWAAVTFTPTSGARVAVSDLARVSVELSEDELTIALDDDGLPLRCHVGAGEWVSSTAATAAELVPVAASAAWVGDHVLHVDVVFLDTPHRLKLRCDAESRTFEAGWATASLHSPRLAQHRAPR